MTAPPPFDPLLATCPHCGGEPGKRCMAVCDWARKPHAARRRLSLALTAHADPALDKHWKRIGPCGICAVPGLDQRHRVIDAIADQLEAPMADPEDDPADWYDDLAAEFGVALEAVEAVRTWAQRWPGAW